MSNSLPELWSKPWNDGHWEQLLRLRWQPGTHSRQFIRFGLLPLLFLFLLQACSIRQLAVRKLGDAISGAGTTVASDDDPELIRAAIPFSLKLMESLLGEMPEHRQLLLACNSGFAQYAYAFVQQDAEEMESHDLAAARLLQTRARKLYLRARDYGLRGLELKHKGISQKLRQTPASALTTAKKEEVPLLYWTALSWAAAISLAKDQPDLVSDLPAVSALIDQAMKLDERFDSGAIHGFMISYILSRPDVKGDPYERARWHYERAFDLSHGQLASPMMAYAENVLVQKQNRKDFQNLMEKVLAIDVDAKPEWRLTNLIMQHRARWLLSRMDELFVE
jgi:predicted anti-sigma-YlaC factor YlaD